MLEYDIDLNWEELSGVVDSVFGGFFIDYVPVAASYYYPRYFFPNGTQTLAETWNWWSFLFPYNDDDRYLMGVICNEDEDCVSKNIPLPYELTVINVADILPPVLKPADDDWAGFGSFYVCDSYDTTTNICWDWYWAKDYSTAGWAYQRVQGSSVQASWDVIHNIDRDNPFGFFSWDSGTYYYGVYPAF